MKKLLWCKGSFFSLAFRELVLRDFKQNVCNVLNYSLIFLRLSALLLACYLVRLDVRCSLEREILS